MVMYAVIATIIGLIVVSLQTCKEQKQTDLVLMRRIDSLIYEYETLQCKKDTILLRTDTINNIVERIKIINHNIQKVSPIDNSDSLLFIIRQIRQSYDGIQ